MSYVVSTFALLVISITMLCRANDLRWRDQWKWRFRLVGFILSGAMPLGIIGMEWATKVWPSPYEVAFRLGLMFVFVTTPYLPPWWRFIGMGERDEAS